MGANIADFFKNAHIWLPGRVAAQFRRRGCARPTRVWVAIADHFEPLWRQADEETARERVRKWRELWPQIAARHPDSAGRPACYTFFYPEEEYRPWLLDSLAEMANAGIADVEVHLHHDGEGAQNFIDRISRFTEALFHRHGLLRKIDGKIAFGFIHGNWALDNSRPDGRWCGLNNEISLLRDLGCYADFTMPSAPSPTQARMVNTIYWATDDPQRPKSYNSGIPITVGGPVAGDLMMIPGPLGLRWRGRGRRLLPGIENGELAVYARPTRHRVRLWLKLAPRIGIDVFIKLFSHGAQERNFQALLGGDLDLLFESIRAECAEEGVGLHFVSAWQMWSAVEALRRGTDPLLALDCISRIGVS